MQTRLLLNYSIVALPGHEQLQVFAWLFIANNIVEPSSSTLNSTTSPKDAAPAAVAPAAAAPAAVSSSEISTRAEDNPFANLAQTSEQVNILRGIHVFW